MESLETAKAGSEKEWSMAVRKRERLDKVEAAEAVKKAEEETERLKAEEKEVVAKASEYWNEVVEAFILARAGWKKFQEHLLDHPEIVEQLPLNLQRVLAKFKREDFYIMAPDFVAYTASYRSLEEMLIPKEEKE